MQTFQKTFDTSNAAPPIVSALLADHLVKKRYFNQTLELISGDDHISAAWLTKPNSELEQVIVSTHTSFATFNLVPANDSVFRVSTFGYFTIGLAATALTAIVASIISALAISGDPLGALLPIGCLLLLLTSYLAASPKVKRNWKKR